MKTQIAKSHRLRSPIFPFSLFVPPGDVSTCLQLWCQLQFRYKFCKWSWMSRREKCRRVVVKGAEGTSHFFQEQTYRFTTTKIWKQKYRFLTNIFKTSKSRHTGFLNISSKSKHTGFQNIFFETKQVHKNIFWGNLSQFSFIKPTLEWNGIEIFVGWSHHVMFAHFH